MPIYLKNINPTILGTIDTTIEVVNNMSVGGSVGIGMTEPGQKLSVLGTIRGQSTNGRFLDLTTSDSGVNWQIWASAGSANDEFRYGSAVDSPLTFYTNGAEVMRIKSGNVGIGTTGPINKLHLYNGMASVGVTQLELEGYFNGYGAGINFSSRTSSGGTLVTMAKITADGESPWNTTGTTQNAGLRFSTTLNGTLVERLRIHSSGNVSISTDDASLVIGGATIGGRIRFGADNSNNEILYGAGEFGFRTNQSAGHNFYTNGVVRLRVGGSANSTSENRVTIFGRTQIVGDGTNSPGIWINTGENNNQTFFGRRDLTPESVLGIYNSQWLLEVSTTAVSILGDLNVSSGKIHISPARDVTINQMTGIFWHNTDSHYCIFRESGAWSHPYPDLRIAFHTGIKIGAYYGYGGTRFYNNSDMGTEIASIGDGDNRFRAFYGAVIQGDVGIGTTSPTYRLHVRGAYATPQLFVGHDSGGGGIFFHAQGASSHFNWLIGQQRTHSGLEFTPSTAVGGTTFNVPAMVIQSNTGNVGIGTTSPSARLDVYSATNLGACANGIRVQRPGSYGQYGYLEYLVGSDMTVLGSLYTGGGAGAFGQLTFRQHSSTTSRDAMVLDSSGNLGIGTTGPGAKLDVKGAAIVDFAGAGGGNLRVGGTTANYGAKVTLLGWAGTNSNWQLDTAFINSNFNITPSTSGGGTTFTTPSLSISSAGNVGIGTTGPEYGLHLGSNAVPKNLAFTIDNSTQAGIIWKYIGQAKINAQISSVGTGSYANKGLAFYTTDTLDTTTNAVERMRITESGNVGIGTAPSQKLHVAGQIYSSSGGIRFPDDTVQSTAATGGLSFAGSAQVFTSNGTFTVPAGVTKIKVTVTGGGSGGSFWTPKDRGHVFVAGGAAGGTAIKWLIVTPGTQCAVVVGAGGVGGAKINRVSSSNGTASSFTHNSVVYAGGIAGNFVQYDGYSYLSGSEVFQSGGEGTNGDLNLSGGDGSVGARGGASYWGGGFGAGGKQFGNGKPGVVVIEY